MRKRSYGRPWESASSDPVSWFDKYIAAHFFKDGSVTSWSDLSSKRKLMMSFKILHDLFGVLIVLALTAAAIDWLF